MENTSLSYRDYYLQKNVLEVWCVFELSVSIYKTCLVSKSYLLEFPKIAALIYDPVKIMRYYLVKK